MTPCNQDYRQERFEDNYNNRTEDIAGNSEFLVPLYQTKRRHVVRDIWNANVDGCQNCRHSCYVISTTEKYAFNPSMPRRTVIIIIIIVVVVIIIIIIITTVIIIIIIIIT